MRAPQSSPPDEAGPPRIAILVLGCLLPVYDRCLRTIRSTWGAAPPDDIDVFYLYGRAVEADLESVDLASVVGQDPPRLDDDEVVVLGDVILCGTGDVYADQIDGILRKRLLAFRHLAEHESYDFVYNVCASSYVDLEALRRYVAGLPRQGVYHGPAGICGYTGHPFVSGASMLLSADVVARLADAADDLIAENDGRLPDDVAIGLWIAEHWCEESTADIGDRLAAGRPATASQLFVLPHGRGMTNWVDTPREDHVPQPDVFHYHFHSRRIREMASFHRRHFTPAEGDAPVRGLLGPEPLLAEGGGQAGEELDGDVGELTDQRAEHAQAEDGDVEVGL